MTPRVIGLLVTIILFLLAAPVAAQNGYPGPQTPTATAVGYPVPATATPAPAATATTPATPTTTAQQTATYTPIPYPTDGTPTNIGIGGMKAGEDASLNRIAQIIAAVILSSVTCLLFLVRRLKDDYQ